MWMIVFGAGASHDSVAPEQWQGRVNPDLQPPLTKHLFDHRPIFVDAAHRYDRCAPLINDLWNVSRRAEAIEQYLESQTQERKHDGLFQSQLMALRFYLKMIIYKTTEEWKAANGPSSTGQAKTSGGSRKAEMGGSPKARAIQHTMLVCGQCAP
jgi:hypothetical protein